MAEDKIFDSIKDEEERQRSCIELIPSENFVSDDVLRAVGSVMINKYSEGYPGKRYYGGNEFIDIAENLAIERAKELFGAEHVNVQPYSGSPANMEVYSAFLNFGDTVLAMSLDHGGHLTHGHKVNFSGRSYNFIHYGVKKDDESIDYEEVRRLALEHKPKMIVSGTSAYPGELDFKRFSEIAEEVGAVSMVDMSHIAGLVAAGVHPSPFPHTDVVTTTTHKTLRGPRGAMILCRKEHAKKIDKAVFPGMQGGPHENMIAGKAVAFREALDESFREYSSQVVKNAKKLGEELKKRGFRLVTGGTENHLLLIDLTEKDITGKEAENILDKAGITCNKNMIPYDERSPFNPSGIRLGTPAVTTRGMREEEMTTIADWMDEVIRKRDEETINRVRKEVKDMATRFPLHK
ncbi:MAG: serine hydroxymethyltransferase [Nanobdellota archaeon]